ncbi:MAG: hypothetical protein ACR2LN_00330 [Candidatus Levyibacteriota bacterium]
MAGLHKKTLHTIYHHVRHTRPKWYHEYHKWEHHNTLHWVTFALSSVVMLLGFINALLLAQQYPLQGVNAASTTVNQQVNQGLLTISSAASANLSAVTVAAASQNSTGNLGTVTVTDNTGLGNGWTANATCSHFIKYNSPFRTGGSAGTLTVDSTATYNNAVGGTYTITIATGGSVGTATFNVTGPESLTNQTTGASVSIGARGLVLDFAPATYTTSDSWTIRVDVIPVTGLQITPGTRSANNGAVLTNVTAGSVHTFSSTSDATSLMSATSGYGLGSYYVNPALQLSIPVGSYASSYVATFTETVQ